MGPRAYKITLDQLRMAGARLKKGGLHPCSELIDKVGNALETNNYDVRPAAVHIKAMDNCLKELKRKGRSTEKKSTMYFLNRYLDQAKHKKK